MNNLIISSILTIIGIIGYIIGIFIVYPGRSLSITLFIIGISLLAIEVWPKKEEIL